MTPIEKVLREFGKNVCKTEEIPWSEGNLHTASIKQAAHEILALIPEDKPKKEERYFSDHKDYLDMCNEILALETHNETLAEVRRAMGGEVSDGK